MLDLKYLEGALSGIAEVGKGEVSFDFNGTTLTMRALLPSEEVEIQKYASVVLEDVGDDDAGSVATMEYLDRFKLALISHSIIAIGETNLRDEEFVSTGQKLPNGQEVKIPRWEAIKKIAETWSRPSLTLLFKKYSELVDKIESMAEGAIAFDPVDLDAEILRIETRLSDLHARKKELEAADKDKGQVTNTVNLMAGAIPDVNQEARGLVNTTFSSGAGPPAESNPAQSVAPEEVESGPSEETKAPERDLESPRPSVRRSSIPQTVSSSPPAPNPPSPNPPAPEEEGPEEEEDWEDAREPQEQAPAGLSPEQEQVLSTIEDTSFVDPEKVHEAQAIIQAESQRLARSRASNKRPPHLDALEASRETAQVGTVDGVDAFRIGQPEVLQKTPQGSNLSKEDVNSGATGSQNPRFSPPRRR